MLSYLEFTSDSLKSFSASLLNRKKSLRQIFNFIDLDKDDRSKSGDCAEIAVAIFRTMKSTKSPTITVNVWPDRWVWVDVREGARAGWLWSFVIEGRLAGGKNWDDLIQELKLLPSGFRDGMDEEKIRRIMERWRNLLVSGPLGRAS